MHERVANLLVGALYLYGIAGFVFAIAFVIIGVKRIDSQAISSSAGFRVLNFPGAAALWPFLLRRWISRIGEPPEENSSWDVAPAQNGVIQSFLQPLDKPVPMVATADIGQETWERPPGRRVGRAASCDPQGNRYQLR